MRELLARMRVGSLNNKIQLKTPRTNMEINSNLSRISRLQSRNEKSSSCKKIFQSFSCEGENILIFSRSLLVWLEWEKYFNLLHKNRFPGLLKIVEITESGRPFVRGK